MYPVSVVKVISGVSVTSSIRYLVFLISVLGSRQFIYMMSGIDHTKYFKLFTIIKIK